MNGIHGDNVIHNDPQNSLMPSYYPQINI